MILILTQCLPPDPGGIEVLVGGLATALAGSGEEVLVLADRIRGKGLAEPVWPKGVTVRRFGGPKPLRRLAKGFAARRLLARAGVQAVVTDTWKSAALLPNQAGVPVLVLAHGNEVLPVASARRVARRRDAFARATVVAANSAYTAALVREALGNAAPRVEIVPLPLPAPLDATPEATAWAASLAEGASPVIASLSRLEPRKGIDQVIRALPALAVTHSAIRFLVAGSGPDRARLEALAASEGVADRVRFLGRIDEAQKAALLARADLFVMPARREGNSVEGFGIVYLEAAWQGCPSLAGREGGAAEAVADGETGLLCDGADAKAVAAALDRLLADPVRLKAMGEAAAARVRAEFLWQHALPRYRALLGLKA
ncbi:glycosyltransferase [Neoroseomonas oryzicola]|uniref:Glycosyltransferase family 4 protein n=1 Tax=Neoroseomonas oryzicola TaxID=535904 RepID=A0A9X9WE13_9PROT|nr:glycosyltransferase family 4 protein [Neoroseomonas oryzicola]NKE16604.1 glycosyltransferase family 4 protein [Neoroseomonas oryzicola]